MNVGHVDPVLLWAWAGVAVLLAVAMLVSRLFHRMGPTPETGNTLLRVRTWWMIAACLFVAMAVGWTGVAVLFTGVCLLALREFVALDSGMPNRRAAFPVLGLGAIAVFGWASLPSPLPREWPAGLAPIAAVALSLAVAWRSLSRMAIGLGAFVLVAGGLVCVVGLSRHEADGLTEATGIRYVFFLLLLTGLNDVAQYVWGKSLGRRAVAPRISPRKTWAGLVGGIVTTSVLAAALAAPLLGEDRPRGLLMGVLIGVGGFAGDIVASAYKRHVGAAESGRMLPGHGGIIDRIDSLCVTAPVLYCMVRFF